MIDPAWQGKVLFYELFFGTPFAYGWLVLIWEKLLREPLAEWRYVLLTYLGASFFIINHYFQLAPFYSALLNSYTVVFMIAYFFLAVAPARRSPWWKVGAFLSSVLFTVGFISFENIARYGVARGWNEFWFMFVGNIAFIALIVWRSRARPCTS